MCTDQGCNYHPNILLPVKSLHEDRYQFRIQLSCANSCHCVTIGSATHSYYGWSASIQAKWSELWYQSHLLLCAANLQQQKQFYSNSFHFHKDYTIHVNPSDSESASVDTSRL